MFLKDAKCDNIEPPYQQRVVLSGGDHSLTFASLGRSFFISPTNLSGNPWIIVLPPVKTISWYIVLLKSKSTL
jgi:hypothetical protein